LGTFFISLFPLAALLDPLFFFLAPSLPHTDAPPQGAFQPPSSRGLSRRTGCLFSFFATLGSLVTPILPFLPFPPSSAIYFRSVTPGRPVYLHSRSACVSGEHYTPKLVCVCEILLPPLFPSFSPIGVRTTPMVRVEVLPRRLLTVCTPPRCTFMLTARLPRQRFPDWFLIDRCRLGSLTSFPHSCRLLVVALGYPSGVRRDSTLNSLFFAGGVVLETQMEGAPFFVRVHVWVHHSASSCFGRSLLPIGPQLSVFFSFREMFEFFILRGTRLLFAVSSSDFPAFP